MGKALQGQNLRVGMYSAADNRFEVFGYSTNCTITLGTETDNSTAKDDTGYGTKPRITAKNWNITVDTLSVLDTHTLLNRIKYGHPTILMWDEVHPKDNRTPTGNYIRRKGEAYLTNVTLNFNDRENSAINLTFTGVSCLETFEANNWNVIDVPVGYTKGQHIRLFLGTDSTAIPTNVIAAAKTLTMQVTLGMVKETTKDTDGDWDKQAPTELTYQISTSALVKGDDEITSPVMSHSVADIEEMYENAIPMRWEIANVSGANNREKGEIIACGLCIISQMSIQAPNRQAATYEVTLDGYGDYEVGM